MIRKNVLVTAGSAEVSDIAPYLSQFGIKLNPGEIVKKINHHPTSVKFIGSKLIVEFFKTDRGVDFYIKTPRTSDLIKSFAQEINYQNSLTKVIYFDDIVKIVNIKYVDISSNNLEKNVSTIIGTAKSCRILCLNNDGTEIK